MACSQSDPTVVTNIGPPSLADATLQLVMGGSQVGTVGDLLPSSIVVEVLDASGQPFMNAPVEWSFADGIGEEDGGVAGSIRRENTDAAGRSAIRWRLGTTAGQQRASVRIVVPSPAPGVGPSPVSGGTPLTLVANAVAGPAASIDVSPDQVTMVEGDSVQLGATVADAYDNVLPSPSIQWLSIDPTVVQATSTGLLRALGEGTASVVVASGEAEATVSATVVAGSVNQIPTASIVSPATDVTITLGDAVNFQGSASDPDGTVASHDWSFGDAVTASVEDPGDHTYQATGTYSVTYQVTDDQGASSAVATRTVTVEGPGNQAPTVTIDAPSQDTTITLGDPIEFLGTAADADGTIQTVGWLFGDGNWAAVEDPGDYTYTAAGTYTVGFQATDDQNAPSPYVTRTVTVVAPANQAPTATIDSPSQDVTIQLGESVNFQGTATDPDGTIATRRWLFGDGEISTAEDPGDYTYDSEGTYSVSFRVWDDDGARSSIARRTVNVVASDNEVPTAAIISPSQNTTITLGDAVDFQGSANDPDGTIASHAWDFDDGNTSDVEDPGSYTYASTGTYDVTYRVLDDQGAPSAVATRTVTVTGTPNQAPTASITAPSQDTTITLGDAIVFQGSASDADGTVATHSWTFGNGATSAVEDPGSYTYPGAGTFSVTYRVWDDQGTQSTVAGRTVTVVDPNPPPAGAFFDSQWNSGEYTDGGKWRGESQWVNNNSLSVTNGVLNINATNDLDSWLQIRSQTGNVADPAIGETISWSWRMMVTQAGTQVPDELTHGIGWGSMAVPNSFAVMYFYTRNGQWRPELYVADQGGARPYGWSRDYPSAWNRALQADVWYDFTVSFERTGSSSWRPTIEVRETDGTLIAGTADFYDWPLRGAANAVSLSSATISNGNARNAVEFVGILNGLAGQPNAVTWGRVDYVRGERR